MFASTMRWRSPSAARTVRYRRTDRRVVCNYCQRRAIRSAGAYPKQVMIGAGEFSLQGVRLGTAEAALSCDGLAKSWLVQTRSLDRPDGASTSIEG